MPNYRPRRYNDDGEYIPHSSRENDAGYNSQYSGNQQNQNSGNNGYSHRNNPYSQNSQNSYRQGNQGGYQQQNGGYNQGNQNGYNQQRGYNPGAQNGYRQQNNQNGYQQNYGSQQYNQTNARNNYRNTPDGYAGGGRYTETKKTVTTDNGDRYEVHDEYVSGKNRKKSGFSTSKGCLSVAIYMAIITAVSILLSFYIIVGVNDMFALKKEDVTIQVEIPKDSNLKDVSKILKDNGVINYPAFFKLFAKITMDDDDSFKHGTYQISTRSDYRQIVKKLTNPATADGGIVTVVFPEGANILQYAELLEENNVCKKDAFLKSVNEMELDYDFLSGINFGEGSDRIYRLEGYLFPNTYKFYINGGSKSAITKMLNSFKENYEATIAPLVKNSGMTLDQILTIASIIERETPDPNEMANVSSVFHNRLKNKAEYPKLQSDATRWYPYATKKDVPENIIDTFQSKYDTTIINGLMPGPICNPGLAAIKAAAQPASTNYYFFYTDKNGKHYYASTYAEHQANVKYCQDNGLAG